MRFVIVAAVASLCALSPATAAGPGGTVGDCISDGIYGNEPNMADGVFGGPSEQEPGSQAGNVLPSQSPGPKVTNPDGSVRDGSSVGDFHQEFGGGSVPAYCKLLLSSD